MIKFSFTFIMIVVNCAMGISFHIQHGMPDRFTQSELMMFDKFGFTDERAWSCQNGELSHTYCKLQNNESEIIVWGDSHATALASSLWKSQKHFSQFTIAGCPSIPGAERIDLIEFDECGKSNTELLEFIAMKKSRYTLIISNRWSYYINEDNLLIDGNLARAEHIVDSLKKLAQEISPNRLIVIGQVPESRQDLLTVARTIHNMKLSGFSTFKDISLDIDFSGLTTQPNVLVIDPKKLICELDKCAVFDETHPNLWLFDTDHISNRYSNRILSLVEW